MRKVTCKVMVKLLIDMDDDIEVDNVISEMNYDFLAQSEGRATIEDMEILDYEVIDSR